MNKPLVLLIAVVLLLGGGTALLLSTLWGTGEDASVSTAPLLHDDPAEGAETPAKGAPLPAPAGLAGEADRRDLFAGERAPGQRVSSEHAGWVAGRVLFPPGSPPDESLRLVVSVPDPSGATTDEGEEREALTTRHAVEADGSFRVPVVAFTPGTTLDVDGRFLYLEQKLDLPAPAEHELLLEPLLGACLRVSASPPVRASERAAELVGTRVRLVSGAADAGFLFGAVGRGGSASNALELDDQLQCEFRGLVPAPSAVLEADPEVFVPRRELELETRPGEVLEITLRFELGARIEGLVRDATGDAVPDARVVASPTSQFANFLAGARRETTTDSEGRFTIQGLRPRKVRVAVESDSLWRVESDELHPSDGEVISGLTLTMGRGLAISGAVRFADGRPATRAGITAEKTDGDEPQQGWFGRGGASTSTITDAEGRFAITGLPPDASFDLVVRSLPPGVTDTDKDESYRAFLKGVEAGTQDLALELAPPEGLRLRVVDSDGVGVERYEVVANLVQSSVASEGTARAKVTGGDGTCVLEDTFAGEWSLRVTAEELVTLEAKVPVGVPQSDEWLVVTMIPAATLRGLVVSPAGTGVAGATVRLTSSSADAPSTRWGRGGRRAEADAEGAFKLLGLRPGAYGATADGEEWAPGESEEVTLSSGVVTEITLSLREGGSLTGEVFGDDGNPDAGVTINAFSIEGGGGDSATADAAGRFELHHLAPSTYTVMAQPNLQSLSDKVESEEQINPMSFMSEMRMTTAEVREGEATHVVLGAPPAHPVRIFGRVSEAGEPVREGMVVALGEGRSVLEAFSSAALDEDGSYELVIDEPGDVVLNYQEVGFQSGGVEFHVRTGEVDELEFDLELPTGRIEGVVLGPEGTPLAGQRVGVERETGLASLAGIDGRGGERTDADGRFVLARLQPGTYALRYGGGKYGRSVLAGVELAEGEAVGGLHLRLTRPGTLEGVVLDTDGRPVGNAAIFVRGAGGHLTERMASSVSDDEGRFVVEGVAPGEVTLTARTREASSAESRSVMVREDAATNVELILESGTILRVVVEDAEGSQLRARVSVRDAKGREHAGMLTEALLRGLFLEGFSSTEQRVGPLPPGKYRVTVTAEDGRSKERNVRLTGRAERKLRLRLDD